jgi:hypothetical protein
VGRQWMVGWRVGTEYCLSMEKCIYTIALRTFAWVEHVGMNIP